MRFLYVDIGSYGHNSDGGIFQDSVLGQRLEANELAIPGPATLPNSKSVTPFCLVGDAAFPLKTYMMRPFPGKIYTVSQSHHLCRTDNFTKMSAGQKLTQDRRIFNYRLSRARRVVENAFGIMATTWRILLKPIETNVDTVDCIVRCNPLILNTFLVQRNFTGATYSPFFAPLNCNSAKNARWSIILTPLR